MSSDTKERWAKVITPELTRAVRRLTFEDASVIDDEIIRFVDSELADARQEIEHLTVELSLARKEIEQLKVLYNEAQAEIERLKWELANVIKLAQEVAQEVGGRFAETHTLNTGLNKFISRLESSSSVTREEASLKITVGQGGCSGPTAVSWSVGEPAARHGQCAVCRGPMSPCGHSEVFGYWKTWTAENPLEREKDGCYLCDRMTSSSPHAPQERP